MFVAPTRSSSFAAAVRPSSSALAYRQAFMFLLNRRKGLSFPSLLKSTYFDFAQYRLLQPLFIKLWNVPLTYKWRGQLGRRLILQRNETTRSVAKGR